MTMPACDRNMNAHELNPKKPITAVIVDDERLSRQAIRLRLADEPDFVIVGEASDGDEAVRLIKETRPDVLFLDVKMPDVDGFEVIDTASSVHLPIVVFVTAHDRFAVQAFERHALDYLLKPFTASRFAAAVARARREVERAADEDTHHGLVKLLDELQGELLRRKNPTSAKLPRYLSRFAVQQNRRVVLVRAGEVEWIESCANYARLHVGNSSYLVRMTMAELERTLDPSHFARIHRSTIVRIDCIETIVPVLHGDFN